MTYKPVPYEPSPDFAKEWAEMLRRADERNDIFRRSGNPALQVLAIMNERMRDAVQLVGDDLAKKFPDGVLVGDVEKAISLYLVEMCGVLLHLDMSSPMIATLQLSSFYMAIRETFLEVAKGDLGSALGDEGKSRFDKFKTEAEKILNEKPKTGAQMLDEMMRKSK